MARRILEIVSLERRDVVGEDNVLWVARFVFPHMVCFGGIKGIFSVEQSAYTARGTLELVRALR